MTVRKKIDVYVTFRQNMKDFSKQMANSMGRFKKMATATGKANKRFKENRTIMGRFGYNLRRLTHGMRGFRMEMLGVMFFGMSLNSFFTGLLKPAMQMAGVFDLMNTILGVVFLPIAMALLDPLIAIGTWLMNLDEGTKLWLGKMVLLGIAIAGVLTVVGTFALGIGSLILAFGSILGLVEKLFPEPMGDMAAAFLGLNAAMMGFDFVQPIWQKIKDVITGVWDKIKEVPAIKKLLDDLGIPVDNLGNLWDTVKKNLSDFFKKFLEEIGVSQEDIDGFMNQIEGLEKQFESFVDYTKEQLIPVMEDFLEIIKDIGRSDVFELANRIARFVLHHTEVAMDRPVESLIGGGVGFAVGGPAGATGGVFLMTKLAEAVTALQEEIYSWRTGFPTTRELDKITITTDTDLLVRSSVSVAD